MFILGLGLFLLWIIASSKWVDDKLFKMISWALAKWTHLEVHDFIDLLHLGEGYSVTELIVEAEDWLVGQRLADLRLTVVGVNVLGIHRKDNDFVGSPMGDTFVRSGDKLIVYGARVNVISLDGRKGNPAEAEKHRRLVTKTTESQVEDDARTDGRSQEADKTTG
jgi:hypothetical protein